MHRKLIAASAAALLSGAANALPPIEAYGELPEVRSVALSPDGKYFAYLTRQDGEDLFAVAEIGGKVIGAARIGDLKARWVWFPTNEHVVIVASETTGGVRFYGKWEHSGAISYNIATKKMKTLIRGTDGLYPAQTGLGRIVGRLDGVNEVFMPAYVGEPPADPDYSLLKVDLDTGRGAVIAKGSYDTQQWLVDEQGVVLAREDWDDKDDTYKLMTKKGGTLAVIHQESKIDLPTYRIAGITKDRSALVVTSRPKGSEFSNIYQMSYDGVISQPMFSRPDRELEGLVADPNRTILGVRYSGMQPSYEFFDASLTEAMAEVSDLSPEASTSLLGWTADYSKLLVQIEGGAKAPAFYLFDRGKQSIVRVANAYARIDDADIGFVTTIEYKARDGRKIPSVVTRPPGAELGEQFPLIVMPHGGPEAYDGVGFDWMAQYFASRGYLVLQPNFRGSDGFGTQHREAGFGEWGGKMQNDITDGVNLLVKYKWADPERICIIGSSYGGYAALAGGAYTPDLYKCVAAIAPVTDLSSILSEAKRNAGKESAVYEYLELRIGDRSKDKAKIEAISPVNAAANFKAPVLLIHGADDTVVPYAHSTKMEAALKKAGKSVKLVKLKGEDHWLSVSETRLQALIELDKFVSETIGTPASAAQ